MFIGPNYPNFLGAMQWNLLHSDFSFVTPGLCNLRPEEYVVSSADASSGNLNPRLLLVMHHLSNRNHY